VLRGLYQVCRGALERAGARNRSVLDTKGISTPHIWQGRNGLLDVDVNLHMNNASYVYAAELARWRLVGQTALAGVALRNKWTLMIGSQAIRYRYAIPPFAKYQITTKVDAVDEHWMYMSQYFSTPTENEEDTPQKVYAHVSVRAIVISLKDGARVSPHKTMQEMGLDEEVYTNLAKPEAVNSFNTLLEWDDVVAETMKSSQK